MTQPDPLAPGGLGTMMPMRDTRGTETYRHIGFTTFGGPSARLSGGMPQQPYAYGEGNPITKTDPKGLYTIPCLGFGLNDNQMPKFSRPGPGLPLMGTCGILGACADILGGKVYVDYQEISQPVPCPPCPTKCWYRLDLDTHTVVGELACTRD